jgi:hypothetical protein
MKLHPASDIGLPASVNKKSCLGEEAGFQMIFIED